MVDQNEAYSFQKRGIFYFSKRVPSDLRERILIAHKPIASLFFQGTGNAMQFEDSQMVENI